VGGKAFGCFVWKILKSRIFLYLIESGEIIKDGLSKKTGAQTLDNLTDILDTVEQVRNNVVDVERSSRSLKDKVNRLKNGLTDSKTRLLLLLDQCFSQKCTDLKRMPEIQSLRVQNDFQNVRSFNFSNQVLIEGQIVAGLPPVAPSPNFSFAEPGGQWLSISGLVLASGSRPNCFITISTN